MRFDRKQSNRVIFLDFITNIINRENPIKLTVSKTNIMKTSGFALKLISAALFCVSLSPIRANEGKPQKNEIDINLVNLYTQLDSIDHNSDNFTQVTLTSQFSDLEPTDWAFQALSNLIEQYGCVAGYPDTNFRGDQSITRYEAAALLNSCLDRVSEITDEINALIRELDVELALIRGRVEGLEARVGELESKRFSPTAKINFALFNWYQANQFSGSSKSDKYNGEYGAFTNTYGLIPALNVSFTGKDYLSIYGLVGSCGSNNVASGNPLLATYAPQCAAQFSSDNSLVLWRMYYSTPVFVDEFKLTVGPRLYAFDFLPVSNAVFGAKAGSMIGLRALPLDMLQNAGVPGVYPMINGPGVGLSYNKDGWSAAAGFVSFNDTSDSTGKGIFDDLSLKESVVQLAVTKPEAGFQLAWTNTNYPLDNNFVFQEGTPLSALPFNGSVAKVVNSFSGGGYWYITEDLSISGGLKKMYYTADSGNAEIDLSAGETASSITGVLTLQWERAFMDELTLGLSYGVPSYVIDNPSEHGTDSQPNALLGFANWSVSNNIQISPWVYWMKGAGGENDPNTSTFGAALMTSFFF